MPRVVLEGSGEILCAEGSGADTLRGSGNYQRRDSVRFRRITLQLFGEVLKGLGRRFPVLMPSMHRFRRFYR